MRDLVSATLWLVGLIDCLPLSGVLGSEQLASLCGVSGSEPTLEILMPHQAVLFGVLGTFMGFVAFRPAYQTVAFVGGFVSVVSLLARRTRRPARCPERHPPARFSPTPSLS